MSKSAADSYSDVVLDTDALIDATGSLIVVFTRQGRIKRFNRACETMTGYTEADVQGEPVWNVLGVPEEKQAIRGIFQQLLHGQLHSYYESTWIGKAGESHVVAWSSTVLTNLLGRVEFIIASGIEVTEQRRSRRQLEGQYRQSRLLAEMTQKIRQSIELKAILQTTVDEVIDLLGCDRVFILHAPLDAAVTLAAEAILAPAKQSTVSDISLRQKSTANVLLQHSYVDYYRHLSISVVDLKDGACISPSQEEILQAASVHSELAVPILTQSPTDVSDAQGSTQEAFWGLLVAHQCELPRRWSPIEIDLMQQLANQIGVAICHAELFDQLEAIVDSRTAELTATNQRLQREMDERLRTEAALKRSENQLTLITNALPALVAYIDRQHRFRFTNFAFQTWYDIPYGQIKGRRVGDIVTLAGYQQMLPYLERAIAGETVDQEVELDTSTGDRRWVSISYIPDRRDNKVRGTIVLINDISDHKAADRIKDEFVSMVSHELRTPLTSVHGALKLLATGQLGSLKQEGQALLEIAVKNTERLTRLINDVLDLERMTTGKIRPSLVCTSAYDLLKNAVETMQAMARQQRISLVIDAPSVQTREPLWVMADIDQIMQALTNLLSNAIKYSPPETTVWIGACLQNYSERPDAVEFWVKDQGPGIPSEHLDSIFERFQQVDSSDGRKPGGTGLGLAICREIVQNHGGRIWVKSLHGQGSTFFFTLPHPHPPTPTYRHEPSLSSPTHPHD